MLFAILRLIGVLWILGFIVFALVATSSYLFSSDPERAQRYSGRLSVALLWPIAVLSSAGRARLRRGQ
jgi:ABC-type Na+ efflux pump permease subunit